jgi:hypothetical protein
LYNYAVRPQQVLVETVQEDGMGKSKQQRVPTWARWVGGTVVVGGIAAGTWALLAKRPLTPWSAS